jgi:hypothetical protein
MRPRAIIDPKNPRERLEAITGYLYIQEIDARFKQLCGNP